MSHHPLIWTLEYTYIVCCSCNIYYCFVSYLVRNQLLIRWSGDPKDLQPNKKWWEHPGYASLHKVLFVRIYFDHQSWCGTAKMYKSWLISFKLDLLHQRFSNQDWMKVLAKKKQICIFVHRAVTILRCTIPEHDSNISHLSDIVSYKLHKYCSSYKATPYFAILLQFLYSRQTYIKKCSKLQLQIFDFTIYKNNIA